MNHGLVMMNLKNRTGLLGCGEMACVLPTRDDGNPIMADRFARCASEAQIAKPSEFEKGNQENSALVQNPDST